jgi:hypothetical protein
MIIHIVFVVHMPYAVDGQTSYWLSGGKEGGVGSICVFVWALGLGTRAKRAKRRVYLPLYAKEL